MQKICLHVECISTKKSYFSRNQSRKGVMKKQFLDLILLLRNWSFQFWCQNSSYNSVNFGAKIQNWDTFCHCFSTLWCFMWCYLNSRQVFVSVQICPRKCSKNEVNGIKNDNFWRRFSWGRHLFRILVMIFLRLY